jgi:hypothetical protein
MGIAGSRLVVTQREIWRGSVGEIRDDALLSWADDRSSQRKEQRGEYEE